MKKIYHMLFFMLVLSACSNSEEPLVNQQVQVLQDENQQLKKELEASKNSPSEEHMNVITGTLNTSFKIIDAMNNKDYETLQSLSVPTIEFDEQAETYTLQGIDDKQNVSLLTSIGIGNLEYRGYTQTNENEVEVFLANYYDEGHVAIYMHFELVDQQWLYKGTLYELRC
ncbi:hypothetical protein ACFQ3J_09195 [Paenibacillus provencensis]|uniref:Lipoprotein n=1 Tax=Paenibacillus provencensis TaxID=441151 RepID=A0ABW3Q4V1_9BACL|nr:hypothetical protein [Paenibacillus sp. MER 78]MCM3128936.1 hypothetical protein [Paenibacillus sp. MER 78]